MGPHKNRHRAYQDVVRFAHLDRPLVEREHALVCTRVCVGVGLGLVGGVPALARVVLVGAHPRCARRKPGVGTGVPLVTRMWIRHGSGAVSQRFMEATKRKGKREEKREKSRKREINGVTSERCDKVKV